MNQKDDKRYVHIFYGECTIRKTMGDKVDIERTTDNKIFKVDAEDLIPVEEYVTLGDMVCDSMKSKTGVVVEMRDSGIERCGVRFENRKNIEFCPIRTSDDNSIILIKKEKPIFSRNEKILVGENRIFVVAVNEETRYRTYFVKINGSEDVISEHYAAFLKPKMREIKLDLFTLDGDIS